MTKGETEAAEQPLAEAYEADATAADAEEYLGTGTPLKVRVGPAPLSALAVRMSGADIDRLRARANAEGIGLTQLARAWILERLDEDEADQVPAEVEAALGTLRRYATGQAT
ncbi:MAG: hypothetical protein ACRD0L_11180 [Acidimicrobiales bacterium]